MSDESSEVSKPRYRKVKSLGVGPLLTETQAKKKYSLNSEDIRKALEQGKLEFSDGMSFGKPYIKMRESDVRQLVKDLYPGTLQESDERAEKEDARKKEARLKKEIRELELTLAEKKEELLLLRNQHGRNDPLTLRDGARKTSKKRSAAQSASSDEISNSEESSTSYSHSPSSTSSSSSSSSESSRQKKRARIVRD